MVPIQRNVVSGDGLRIAFDHYQRGHSRAVILAPGFFNSKGSVLLKALGEALTDSYDVIIMDFRGHGKSSGFFCWTAREYLDLTAVLDYARGRYSSVGLIGFSLGAATGIVTAAGGGGIDSLVAVSAPVEFGKIEFHFWRLDIENDIVYALIGEGRRGKGVRPGPFWLKKKRPVDLIGEIKAPTLFIHGDRDWLIRPWHSRALFDKARCRKKLVFFPGGPHAEYLIRKNKEEFTVLIKDWFRETLCARP